MKKALLTLGVATLALLASGFDPAPAATVPHVVATSTPTDIPSWPLVDVTVAPTPPPAPAAVVLPATPAAPVAVAHATVHDATPAPASPVETAPAAPPVAQDGPQPFDPGVTNQVTSCYISWTITQDNPDHLPQMPETTTLTDGYTVPCGQAEAALASTQAQYPDATLTERSYPQTTSTGYSPGS